MSNVRYLQLSMTPPEQIEALRKMASRGILIWIALGSALLAIILGIASSFVWNPIYLMISFLAAVIALSARQAMPHIHRAASALDLGIKSQGKVQVTADESSDSVTYFATVPSAGSEKWIFEFIPLGWHPKEGSHEAAFFRIPGVAWPALIQVEQGIIYPRSQPTLQSDA